MIIIALTRTPHVFVSARLHLHSSDHISAFWILTFYWALSKFSWGPLKCVKYSIVYLKSCCAQNTSVTTMQSFCLFPLVTPNFWTTSVFSFSIFFHKSILAAFSFYLHPKMDFFLKGKTKKLQVETTSESQTSWRVRMSLMIVPFGCKDVVVHPLKHFFEWIFWKTSLHSKTKNCVLLLDHP